jgi:hypothetical protein
VGQGGFQLGCGERLRRPPASGQERFEVRVWPRIGDLVDPALYVQAGSQGGNNVRPVSLVELFN